MFHTWEFSPYVCLTLTYINVKGAEAPDTYQAWLLLLGKVYTGCFHHLPPLRFHSELWLLQLKVIVLSFQTDIYQCKIITHGSHPRVKLKRPDGRSKKDCRCKERAVDSSHPSCMFPVTCLRPPDQASCPYHSSRTSLLIQDPNPISEDVLCEAPEKPRWIMQVNKKHMEVFEAFNRVPLINKLDCQESFPRTSSSMTKKLHCKQVFWAH